jgi:excisionase family DNA binding protein
MTSTRPNVALDGHYSISEAASLLGVHRKTIYRWIGNGYMKKRSYRHSRRPFVVGTEIIKIFNACS